MTEHPTKQMRFLGDKDGCLNLSRCPIYVAGESEVANDFDLQFEGDNALRFYTAAGTHISYFPAVNSLVGKWHMILVTQDTVANTRALYWDGKLAVADHDSGRADKTHEFTIGAGNIFGGRWFDGGIAEVALWNYALTGKQVAAIYASRVPRTH